LEIVIVEQILLKPKETWKALALSENIRPPNRNATVIGFRLSSASPGG